MAIYEEKQLSPRIMILILFAVLLVTFPLMQIGGRELFFSEGETAAAITEMNSFPPAVSLHGELNLSQYPLYPLLCKGFMHITGATAEFSLRFISVLSLAVLAALTGYNCYRSADVQAGVSSAAIVLTSFLAAWRQGDGYPHVLTQLILYSGWMIWMFFLVERQRKTLTPWICLGIFSGLSFYSAGYPGLLYFLIPLCIQRRPMNLWKKLQNYHLFAAAVIVCIFYLMWLQPGSGFHSAVYTEPVTNSVSGYLLHFFSFPVKFLFWLLPWSLMLWAPFCMILEQVNKNPLFSRYLKTIFSILFLLLWFNPNSSSRELFYIVPVAATLCGLNYSVAVRRHGFLFRKAFLWMAGILLFGAACYGTYLLLPPEIRAAICDIAESCFSFDPVKIRNVEFPFGSKMLYLSEIMIVILLESAVLMFHKKIQNIWIQWSMVFCGLTLLCLWTAAYPYKTAADALQGNSKRELGNAIRAAVESDIRNIRNASAVPAGKEQNDTAAAGGMTDGIILYKGSDISGLYGECYYSGFKTQTISLHGIPQKPKIMYILTTDVPTGEKRMWTRVLDKWYKNAKISLYRGEIINKEEVHHVE